MNIKKNVFSLKSAEKIRIFGLGRKNNILTENRECSELSDVRARQKSHDHGCLIAKFKEAYASSFSE